MFTPYARSLRRLLLPALLALCPAWTLKAEVSITLIPSEGEILDCRPGDSQDLVAVVHGAPPGVKVAWTVSAAENGLFPVDLEPGIALRAWSNLARFQAPFALHRRTYVVEASVPGAWARVTFWVPGMLDDDPGTLDAAPLASPSSGKRARTQAPPPSILSRLPKDLAREVASYAPGSARGINRSYREYARLETRSLWIRGANVTDHSLRQLVEHFPSVRTIKLEWLYNATTPGVVTALAQNPHLEALTLGHLCRLGKGDLVRVLAEHPHLSTLNIEAEPDLVDDAILARFGSQFRHLRLRRAEKVHDAGLACATALETLDIAVCPEFTGAGLSPQLRALSVRHCPLFLVVPPLPRLERLSVLDCRGFDPDPWRIRPLAFERLRQLVTDLPLANAQVQSLPASLVLLALRDGSRLVAPDFRHLPGLAELELLRGRGLAAAHLPPRLRRLQVGDDPEFNGAGLDRIPLENLAVERCPSFQGGTLPPSLRRLRVWDCKGCTPRRLFRAMTPLGVLDRLEFGLWRRLPEITPEQLDPWRNLRSLMLQRLPTSPRPDIYTRPDPGGPFIREERALADGSPEPLAPPTPSHPDAPQPAPPPAMLTVPPPPPPPDPLPMPAR